MSDDISKGSLVRCWSVSVPRRVEEKLETQVAHVGACERDSRSDFSGYRSAGHEFNRATCVTIILSEIRDLWRHVGDFLEPTAARGGPWLGFG